MKTQLQTYVRAGYPALFIVTPEEQRAEAEIKAAASELNYALHVWSITEGLINTTTGAARDAGDALAALTLIESLEERSLIVLRDFGLELEDADSIIIRKLRDVLRTAKTQSKTLLLLGCEHKLPAELHHEITVLRFALPGKEQLGTVLDAIGVSGKLQPLSAEKREPALNAATGLTTIEAENAFALSVIECGEISPSVISREKAHALKQGGLLEVIEGCPSLDVIGGLDVLKGWLIQRKDAFSDRARAYGLPSPKGLLILGIPGTGKSLTAKATASVFGLPLLRLDAGRIFAGLVGQSEANLRSALQTAEAISPCVLWLDELEKAFAGTKGSGGTDGGTSSRVFGSFLSWMQEKTAPVFVVATANDVSQLPPEFLRKGRFDEVFFVDLPNQRERADIWELVIRKFERNEARFDHVMMARASETYTGAEIEQAFIEAMHAAFAEHREPNELDVANALCNMVPLASLMGEEIERLRRWAQGRARHATHSSRSEGRRKLDL